MLTLPVGPDRERAVRAARLWFELCAARLHREFARWYGPRRRTSWTGSVAQGPGKVVGVSGLG
ncbi:hypothetical protein DMB66_58910 [Actinoplanes sp. ATCC 53533]|uniref:hypothetical protein n=1 Tax=Actinoplanes sp. ATCC 53533 TaxID=1288362 RepID=UPI000F76A3CB|nr:hypothetical protein [Actinoplanes sp. ATCC 53533]RSM38559.1 hypothetical protein DMB66_58910 [Actinoplanes sp. ATCC 53533]